MKKSITVLCLSYLLISCMDNTVVLPRSVGAFNKVIVVAKGSLWAGDVGEPLTMPAEHLHPCLWRCAQSVLRGSALR